MNLLNLCLGILPGLLLAAGLAAVFGLLPIGPRELPKAHPINRKLGGSAILLAIGLALFRSGSPYISEGGLVTSVVAVLIWTLFIRQARKQYPPVANEFLERLKSQSRQSGGQARPEANKDKEA